MKKMFHDWLGQFDTLHESIKDFSVQMQVNTP